MTSAWPTKKIKEFCEFKYGKNLPADKRVDGPYPVYGSSSIASYHEDYLIEAPGLIIGRKGTVGKVQLSKENYFPIDTTFYVDKTCTEENIFFLYYFFQLCGFEDMNSDAAVPGLNRNAAINIKVSLPPREVQNKIATVLLAYDDLIENNLKRIKLLEEMAQITYEEWFVRMKFPGHETAVFDEETGLPDGWSRVNINSLYTIKYGKNLPQELIEEQGDYPVYGASDKVMGYYSQSNVKHPCVLITSRGNGSGDIHRTYEEAFVTNNSFTVIPQSKHLSIPFTMNLLSTVGLHNYCSGAAQPQLTNDALNKVFGIVPNDELVKSYNKLAKPSIETADLLRKQNKFLKEARDIILPRLMTGMIDIEQVELPEAMLKRLEQQEDKMAAAV